MIYTTGTSRQTELTKNQELNQYVSSKVNRLQASLLGKNPSQESRARAVLAKLRKASFSADPVHSEAWQIVLGETGLAKTSNTLEELFPENLQNTDDSLSNYELAAYTAIVGYANHQQSQSQPMHIPHKPFAASVGELVTKTSPSTKSRFDSLTSALTPRTINLHLKTLLTLLRSQSIGFDYGQLAVDLAQLYIPAYRNTPLMRFSRDFVSGYLKTNSLERENTTLNN